VVEHATQAFPVAAAVDPQWEVERLLFVGDDRHGVPLEVMGIELDNGGLLIHPCDEGAPRISSALPASDGRPLTMKTKAGKPVTADMIDALSAEAERGYDPATVGRRRIGRPSLAGEGESPRVQYRVPPTTYSRALRRAQAQGMATISALSRALLEAYADGTIKLPPVVQRVRRPKPPR
jgi:hypothetical protein